MSHPSWLNQWMDEFGIKSERRLERALAKEPRALERLSEIASEWLQSDPSISRNGTAIVAGRGGDLSGSLGCHHHECRGKQLDQLANRLFFYFDDIVVTGPQAANYEEIPESRIENVRRRLRDDVKTLLHIREVGAEPLLTFAPRDTPCEDHYLQHADEVGVLDVVQRGRAWISELASSGRLVDLTRHEDHWHYSFDYPSLEHRQWGSVGTGPDGDAPTAYDVAERVYIRYAAGLTSDVGQARRFGLPLGTFVKVHADALSSKRPTPSSSDVAFELSLPVLSHLPVNEIISIRNNERESFERFQRSISEAIQDRIDAGDENPKAIADQIVKDVIDPALSDISQRLRTASKVLERKSGTSLAAGAAITTVGLLTGAPLVAGLGVVALGTNVTAAHKYFDDKASVELSDMYFLWRLHEEAHGYQYPHGIS